MRALWFVLSLMLILVRFSSSSGEGANTYDNHDIHALRELWRDWNATPDVAENLAGWNALVETDPPCASTSPWRGVYCNAKRQIPMNGSDVGSDVWKFEIVGLTLKNASIVGSMNPAIGNLTNLVTLTLSDNPRLQGPLPEELGQLQSLFDIDLHSNGLNGTIPKFFYDAFAFLQSIDVSDNQFTGVLPSNNTVSFRTIQTMNISRNLFSGPIPPKFALYLHNLVSADLSHNRFSGGLPPLISPNKSKVLDLDFSNNILNGSFPMLSGHQTIRFFNVSGNQLSGELDAALLSNIPSFRTLDVSRNQFTGAIPDLSSLSGIEFLDLSYNNFTPGPCPKWSNGFKNLHTLMLRGVSVTGAVPASVLVGFESLQTLALDHNNLTGTLDIDRILDAAKSSRSSRQMISLTNNNITDVAYSQTADKLVVKFNLSGNPYCDDAGNPIKGDDLRRCVCQQQCFFTGTHDGSDPKKIIISTVVCAFFILCGIAIYSFVSYQTRRERKNLIIEVNQKFAEYEVKPTIYTYGEIRTATADFSPDMKLGKGHYGAVYKGTLANGTDVAVKQLFSKSQQSLDVFLNEIVLVAAVKHKNLVKLKGCCIRKDQRLLVHEFVEVGDLEQVLFEHSRNVNLTWPLRRNICLGVANGIHYLHSLSQPTIIHRDIKANNVLLDKNMEPKIADFGLALLFPDDQSHIMTIHVAGTRGYLAPEYATLGQLSQKVDVYSFGVLLFEIVSGRRNIDPDLPEEQVYLLEWAWKLRDQDRSKELIDKSLSLQIDEEIEIQRILDIAFLCVYTSAEKRPLMARVVAMLQGDIDFDGSELGRFRDESRLDKRLELGPIHFPSSTSHASDQSSITSNDFYWDQPHFVGSTPSASRDSLLSGVGRALEMRSS